MELKSKEETITMSTSDFKQLIADEVNRTLKQQGRCYTPQNVFNFVSIKDIDIQKINEDSSIVSEWSDKCSFRGRRLIEYGIYTQNMFNTSGYGSTHKITSTGVHELLRKLSISVLGHTANGDIRYDEFELAQQYYEDFKNVWLGLYKQRLSDMEEDK